MSIDTNKPEPLDLGGVLHYTLSSYEPVEVEVTTARTTDADVDFAFERICIERGCDAKCVDDVWAKKEFNVDSLAQLKNALKQDIERANAMQAEREKQAKCAEELSKRLEQKVPASSVQRYQALIEQDVMQNAMQMKIDFEQFKQLAGIADATIAEMAETSATQEAAFNAYAEKKGITVSEDEVAGLLGAPQEQVKDLLDNAKKEKKLDTLLKDLAVRKAADEIVTEARVTYQVEPEESSKERASHYPELIKILEAQAKEQKEHGGCCGGHGHGDGECCGGHDHGDGECCGEGAEGHGHGHGHKKGDCNHGDGCGCDKN